MVVRLDDLYFPVQTFRLNLQGSSGITPANYKVYHVLECIVLHVYDYLKMCKHSVPK